MKTRVRDIPPGIKFRLERNGNVGRQYTMIKQHEERRYLYRVLSHSWHDKTLGLIPQREVTLNGQSYAKSVIRVTT